MHTIHAGADMSLHTPHIILKTDLQLYYIQLHMNQTISNIWINNSKCNVIH